MSKGIFDLEQQILQCWNVVDDIKLLYKHFGDNPRFEGLDPKAEDEMMNLLLGLESMYQLKFDTMFRTFEDVAHEFHRRGRLAQLDREQELSEMFNKVMDEPIK
jgi:hypothetical protein